MFLKKMTVWWTLVGQEEELREIVLDLKIMSKEWF